MIKDNILLVGCGKMGGALLGGLIEKVASKDQILVIDPSSEIADKYGVRAVAEIDPGFKADAVILAVKPQIIESLLPKFSKMNEALFISIAAGKTLQFFAKHLGDDKAIIRSMPNLPALVGQGATVLCANENVVSAQKKRADELFQSVGKSFWIDDESLLDAVTAISGSGPAYVFHFMECLINAGIKLGLPEELAVALANSTVRGSAELAGLSDKTVKELKQQVVSPKGTTEAGLKVLESGLADLIEKTAVAACNRSKELA